MDILKDAEIISFRTFTNCFPENVRPSRRWQSELSYRIPNEKAFKTWFKTKYDHRKLRKRKMVWVRQPNGGYKKLPVPNCDYYAVSAFNAAREGAMEDGFTHYFTFACVKVRLKSGIIHQLCAAALRTPRNPRKLFWFEAEYSRWRDGKDLRRIVDCLTEWL